MTSLMVRVVELTVSGQGALKFRRGQKLRDPSVMPNLRPHFSLSGMIAAGRKHEGNHWIRQVPEWVGRYLGRDCLQLLASVGLCERLCGVAAAHPS